MWKSNKKIAYYILSILVVANLLIYASVYDLSRPKLLKVVFLDVGQGDSIFIETPKRQKILIDGGPDTTVVSKLSRQMPFYDRTINLVILTHPDLDHVAGLLEVLKRYKVENILWTGIVKDTPEYEKWIELIKNENTNIQIAYTGEDIKMGEVNFKILSPLTDLSGQKPSNVNATSIVAKMTYENDCFLFTGDITNEAEVLLPANELKCDVLKIPHHGSKDANNGEFIKNVSPKYAVIEVGENKYGHPSPEVLEFLRNSGIQIFRTDENRDITFLSDGKSIIKK